MVPIAYGRAAELGGVGTEKGGVDPRLKPAAQEFEASLMQELLKPMEKDPLFSGSDDGGDGLMTGGSGTSAWGSLGAESLARALARDGGFGIAKKIMTEVAAQAKQAQGGKAATAAGVKTDCRSGTGDEALPAGRERLDAWGTARRLP